MIYLVNLSEKDFMRKKNKWLPKIKEYIDKNDPGATVIPFSGTFEQKLMDFESDDERKAYCEETKCTSILDKIVVQGYKALQLQYFFTAGEDEVTVERLSRFIHCPSFVGILALLIPKMCVLQGESMDDPERKHRTPGKFSSCVFLVRR